MYAKVVNVKTYEITYNKYVYIYVCAYVHLYGYGY